MEPTGWVGIDTVEVARVKRLLEESPREDLLRLFSAAELTLAAEGGIARVAARFAAKEACLKLFPRETALSEIGPGDFEIANDPYGAPQVMPSPVAADVLARHWLEGISLSISHDRNTASAVALARVRRLEPPRIGKWLYKWMPIRRRVVLGNLRRALGGELSEEQIVSLAQCFYGHVARSAREFVGQLIRPAAAPEVRVENHELLLEAEREGKGALLLSGHLGNWEVALVGAMQAFPQFRGRFYVLRRPLPAWLEPIVGARMRKAGLGVLPKRGSLEALLGRLAANDAVAFIMDQHAGGRDGVLVDFFGAPAWTFRSLALVALATGAPVFPVAIWREPRARGWVHVMRFLPRLSTIEDPDLDRAVAANTRAYNLALEQIIRRHPEQWFWFHRRWKPR